MHNFCGGRLDLFNFRGGGGVIFSKFRGELAKRGGVKKFRVVLDPG